MHTPFVIEHHQLKPFINHYSRQFLYCIGHILLTMIVDTVAKVRTPGNAMPRFQQILAPHLCWVTLRTEGIARFNSNTSLTWSYKKPFTWQHNCRCVICTTDRWMSTCRQIMRTCRKCSIQIVQESFSQRLQVLIMTIVCYNTFIAVLCLHYILVTCNTNIVVRTLCIWLSVETECTCPIISCLYHE